MRHLPNGRCKHLSVSLCWVRAHRLRDSIVQHQWYIRFGPSGVMGFGALCFFLVGFVLFFLSNNQLAAWGVIIPYYCLYGAARGVWESTNKAAVADIFEFHPEVDSAFAAIYFTSAFTGSVGYYILPYLTRDAMAFIITISSVAAIASYLGAVQYHRTHHLVSTSEH